MKLDRGLIILGTVGSNAPRDTSTPSFASW